MIDPLEKAPPLALSLLPTKEVPTELPTTDVPYRLAIVGEAPGADEEVYGKPFIGASGKLLNSILSSAGILRSGCLVGNICRFRPPDNKIETWGYEHHLVLAGWEKLKDELKTFGPHAILALGNTPLHFLTSRSGITSWRGSIISTEYGKVIPSIHPAAVLREYKQWVLLRFDTVRARQEAETPSVNLPQRILELDLTAYEICSRLDNWPAGREASFDIEGGLEAWPCCSIADESNHGFIIAWNKYSESAQADIYRSLGRFLHRADVPKVLQNSLYDRFVLAYGFKTLIRNVRQDTMLKTWEIYSELPKGLGTIASIFTREPYYKFERKSDSPDVLHQYCIRDSCVTLEASRAMDTALAGLARSHYHFNMGLLSPLLYMELRGIRYDRETAASELANVKSALAECASRLHINVGHDMRGSGGSLSPLKLRKVLYNQKGYPEMYKGRGPTKKVTTDVDALLKLKKKFSHDPFLSDVLLHRRLESLQETLAISTDPDGRVRCGYNVVGTETGRLTCYTSPTGSGANLQTITKKLRKLYLADDDHWMFQCDLSGADGWTVAAHCLRHGDPTMWEDYMFGLKPARIVALMYDHGYEISKCSREELKERCKEVDDDGWLYFACKRIQHATNYGVQEKTVSDQIMVDSYKITGSAVYVDAPTCAALQRLYFVRYAGLYQWHNWARREVAEGRNATSASGHTRVFFGRRKSWSYKTKSFEADHETWKEFLANEPQDNTTYANNLALQRLWNDPTDRYNDDRGKVRLRVEPLHTVHDAVIGQFRKTDTDWAVKAIRGWYQNELTIANQKVIIPFEGRYGRSWGELTEGTI